ncbi:hypothetical protein [Gimesia aquarii]|uniref:hypothetical protein n=1 Tax=Gimesia aquarii TaxID=2527964 RepID=UPI0011A22B4B|nr:hypothetical protein [Gimesia aquarii]
MNSPFLLIFMAMCPFLLLSLFISWWSSRLQKTSTGQNGATKIPTYKTVIVYIVAVLIIIFLPQPLYNFLIPKIEPAVPQNLQPPAPLAPTEHHPAPDAKKSTPLPNNIK